MGKFGWSYPAGAASDPNAPYNQGDIEDNSAVEKALEDYSGPYDVYRSTYKYTPCGPTVGFTFYAEYGQDNGEPGPASTYEPPENRTFYCDDLRQFGSWADLREQGLLITEMSVSSIVEGEVTSTHYVDCDGFTFEPEDIRKAFDDAVEAVNKEANDIWNETHGCEDCFDYPEGELHPVDPDCKTCGGHGTSI